MMKFSREFADNAVKDYIETKCPSASVKKKGGNSRYKVRKAGNLIIFCRK